MDTPIPSLDEIAPAIRHVLHPSDFSEASRVAFVHALKVALITKAKLSLIHETNDEQRDWSEFPDVQETLERWGILPAGSATEAVSKLGIETAKIIGRGSDPVKGVLDYLKDHGADLVVLATRPLARGLSFRQSLIGRVFIFSASSVAIPHHGLVGDDDRGAGAVVS